MDRGVHVPLTSLSLVSTFVAALQTIRSTQGLTRLENARVAQQRMVVYTRDIALLLAAYVLPRNRAIGLKAARHMALFGWALKSHLRETDGNDIIDVLLPNPADAEYLKGARKKPVAIISRLRQMMAYLGQRGAISSTAHRLIEDNLRNLDDVIAASDKLRATPIPCVYGSHLGRLMVFYLVFLPFALLGSSLNGLSAVATTMTVGFAMAGLDEMSSMFELPFRFMPLYQLAKVSMIDVADAFCRSPPPLDATASDVESVNDHIPLYWAGNDDPFLPYDGREQRQRAGTK
jgi:ion channel-forming bestrophin family protein